MRCSFDYAIVRVVPRVERGEFLNVGVALFCSEKEVILARMELSEPRLLSLAPWADLALIRDHLSAFCRICEGGPGSGTIGELPPRERWRWLVAPRSTILQTSPPHVGLGDDLHLAIERILDRSVRLPTNA